MTGRFRALKLDRLDWKAPVQRGVEGGVDDMRQRPGRAVAGEGTGHWPAIAEEENVDGLEEDGVHARCLSAGATHGFGEPTMKKQWLQLKAFSCWRRR
jgi:hypothetical protein